VAAATARDRVVRAGASGGFEAAIPGAPELKKGAFFVVD